MIIVQLSGGLGNQLFQYAMGRALAIRNNAEFKYDLSFFETYNWHEYSLDPLCIKKKIATKTDVKNLRNSRSPFVNKISRRIFKHNHVIITEENLSFNSKYLDIKSPAYLCGYWQSEKYFKAVEDLLRNEFIVKLPPSKENNEILDNIQATHSISLHVRRGNYVQNESVNKVHGTCSQDYYTNAINMMSDKFNDPVFYIFSDDISWVKKNLIMPYKHHFVDVNNDKSDYEDLRLMYSCKHNILANSTFSWWGAWLNNNFDKVVITPKQWFVDEILNNQTKDLIPETWIRI